MRSFVRSLRLPDIFSTHTKQIPTRLLLLTSAALLSSCGGGGSDSAAAPVTVADTRPIANPLPTVALKLSSIEYAQTHVLPEAGLKWTLPNDTASLKLVGGREATALVKLAVSDAVKPVINATSNGASLGKITLRDPSALPKTEADGAPQSPGLYSAALPASWLVKGVSLTVSADNYLPSAASTPTIGAPSTMDLNIIPFYLFGATDSNAAALSTVASPSAAIKNDIFDKWPVAELRIKPFNGGRVSMPALVVAPRKDQAGVQQPAYLLSNMDGQKDGFAAMDSVLNLMKLMRSANGENATNNLYYGPMIPLNAAGRQAGLGGGLGGGGGGVGDASYSGVFIHEMGHAFGLPHANDGYVAGKYPYAGGSTKGSAWGFNQIAGMFLNLLIDKSASNYNNCAASRQATPAGGCYKQDPMQGGHEDRSAGFRYGTFSDFNIGKIQQWFEGKTSVDANGVRSHSGGVIFPDAKFASGYARWDSVNSNVVEYVPALSQGGLYGINDNLPVAKNVPVYTIMIAFSQARSAGASMIYQPVKHTGNLLKSFDPTSAQDLADFTINTGKYYWYCVGSGCDYSVRVTYSDGSIIHRVLKNGFRSWFNPTLAYPASTSDPLSGDSFRTWAINVPGDKTISKIEMLETPMVWKGMPASPTVLLSRG